MLLERLLTATLPQIRSISPFCNRVAPCFCQHFLAFALAIYSDHLAAFLKLYSVPRAFLSSAITASLVAFACLLLNP